MELLKGFYLVLACMVGFLLLASAPVESAQIVVTRASQIQVIELGRGPIKDLADLRGGDNPICLPNGKGIVFVRPVKFGRDFARELFLLEPQQKEAKQITFDMDVRIQFAAAPDGEQLAYISNVRKGVHVIRLDTRQSTQLTTIPAGVNQVGSHALAWSPDSKRLALAFQGDSQHSYRASFYVFDTFTRRLITISTPPATAPLTWSPWSADGTKLALGGMQRTSIIDVAGDPPRIVRDFPGYVEGVHWSSDGTKLAFTQGKEGKYCDSIYVLDLQGGSKNKLDPWVLFGSVVCFHGPSWSADSKMLAFLGYVTGGEMFPWPEDISDRLYIADKNLNVKRVTEDLKTRNLFGASWCTKPLAFEK